MSKGFEDLNVWNEAMILAEEIYKATSSFPKSEMYGLANQMRRSATSVPSNIAEGASRNTTGEFVQFIGIDKGTLTELKTQALLSYRISYISEEMKEKLVQRIDSVARMLNALKSGITSNQKLATSN